MLGIDIRQSDKTLATKVIIRASIFDTNGAPVTTGDTILRLAKLAIDGTLTFWNTGTNTWQATASEITMTYRGAISGQTGLGIWSVALDAGTGAKPFTERGIYIANVYHASGYPLYQEREFQYAGQEGDDIWYLPSSIDSILGTLSLSLDAISLATPIDANVTKVAGDDVVNPMVVQLGEVTVDANVVSFDSDTTGLAFLIASLNTMLTGAVSSSPSVTGFQSTLAQTREDLLIGRVLIFTSGSNEYKAVSILSYDDGLIGTSDMEIAPEVGDTFVIV